MKNQLLKVTLIGYSFLFIIACGTGCVSTNTNIGRSNSTAIISQNGTAIDTGHSDANGIVTHPCGTNANSVL